MLRSRWIQLNSICNLRVRPWLVLAGTKIKSNTLISMSRRPWWPGRLKCLPISSVRVFLLIDPLCPKNLFWMLSPVWPTYYLRHDLQVMQYIRLLLLHVTFFLHSYSRPVTVLVILPVLEINGQKSHFIFEHLFNPWLFRNLRGALSGFGSRALTKISFRFSGRRVPKITLVSPKLLVAIDLLRISQFFFTMSFGALNPGL